jgi:hypothetical protein
MNNLSPAPIGYFLIRANPWAPLLFRCPSPRSGDAGGVSQQAAQEGAALAALPIRSDGQLGRRPRLAWIAPDGRQTWGP